ncbi:MAG: CRTAC1 family protein, partial [Planctomycetota bacterium]
PATGVPAAWDSRLGARPKFTDIARSAGVTFAHTNGYTGKYHYPEVMGAGVALLDYDGDGFLDIYFTQGNRLLGGPSREFSDRLYRNNGDGTFTDVTERAGLGHTGYGQGVCVGDYDNDGDPDIYVSNFGPNVLYRNDGDGTFTDVTEKAGVGDGGWGQGSSFLDFDGDGRLDLYVQNYLTYSVALVFEAYIYVGERKVLDYPSPRAFSGAPDRLFRNRGDGTFADVTAAAGIDRPDGKGMGCACFDYDDDGDVDLFVSNDTMENFLFRNRGDGTFEEVGLLAGVAFDASGIPEASMGVDVGDFDGDGRMDMIVPCVWGQVFTLYRNEGSFFTDVSNRAGIAEPTSPLTGFSPAFIDYDDDGDLDLFFADGGVRMEQLASIEGSYEERYGIRDLLLANDGTGRYADVSAFAGPYFAERGVSRGTAVGDLDNDGDLDIVVTRLGGPPAILRNDTQSSNHWVTLKLVGLRGNRDAIGASVWCEAGGKRRRAVVHGGVSYLSQSDRRVHFGLGAADRIERLEILWPGGTRQTIEDLPADRRYEIREGEAPAR